MNQVKIPYGEADFKVLRYENYIYIDKTNYIEKLENYKKAIYVRPRRFGKSLFTSMISYYYDINETDNFEKLYKGLYIYDNPTENKNNYYILKFNFSGMNISENKTETEIERYFNENVYTGCREFIDKYNLPIQIKEENAASMTLMELLRKFRTLRKEHKIYILIDEYDHFTNGMLEGNVPRFVKALGQGGFVRAFYEIIKMYAEGTDSVVDRFFATGVVPVSLDNFSSGFNIAMNISTECNYVAMCGFKEKEVQKLVEDVGLENTVYEELKKNYYGYRFSIESEEHTFNSKQVIYYLQSCVQKGGLPIQLVNPDLETSEKTIEAIVNINSLERNYQKLVELTTKGEVRGQIIRMFELNNHRFDMDSFLSLLFYHGYITIKDVGFDVKFCVPNYVSEVLYAGICRYISRKVTN